MINIFIGLSQNQVNSYQGIIPIIDGVKNILITSRTLSVKTELFNEIIYTEKSFNNQSKGSFNAVKNIIIKITTYKKIIKQLKEYKTVENIRLYFTYIEDVLTNYLLFSFNKHIEGIVVEDGTLNYYEHTIKNLDSKKIWFKKILSDIFGIPFKLYKGHSSGIEYKHVRKQYVRVPELSLFPEKSEKLPFKHRHSKLTETVLIIGQEAYIHQYGKPVYQDNLKDLFTIIKESDNYQKIHTIYYKPHRNGERINYQILHDFFTSKKIVILEADTPLEDLYFNTLNSKYIYAFDSSALLNIHLENDNKKDEIQFTVLLRYNKLLKDIFKKFGFTIIE